jgi:hypothetical protein
MLKKLTLLAVSVAALLAFAAPGAQATGPLVTNAFGEAAKTLSATSTNTTVTTSIGTFACTTVILNGVLTTNADTTASGHGTGTAEGTTSSTHTGHCGTSGGTVVEVTNITISDVHATRHGTETIGTHTISITYDLRSTTGGGLIAECTAGGTVSVEQTGPSTGNISGELKKNRRERVLSVFRHY